MSMFSEYVRERMGDEILERDEGFATYRFIDHNEVKSVYIVDIFTRPDFRKTKIASEMADKIALIGKTMGCKQMLGTVSSAAKSSTDSIKVLLAYGFEFDSCNQDGMLFKKGI